MYNGICLFRPKTISRDHLISGRDCSNVIHQTNKNHSTHHSTQRSGNRNKKSPFVWLKTNEKRALKQIENEHRKAKHGIFT